MEEVKQESAASKRPPVFYPRIILKTEFIRVVELSLGSFVLEGRGRDSLGAPRWDELLAHEIDAAGNDRFTVLAWALAEAKDQGRFH